MYEPSQADPWKAWTNGSGNVFLIERTDRLCVVKFYLCGLLKHLRWKSFTNNEKEVQKCLRDRTKEFFAHRVRKLQERCVKRINVGGDSVDQTSPNSSKTFLSNSHLSLYLLNDSRILMKHVQLMSESWRNPLTLCETSSIHRSDTIQPGRLNQNNRMCQNSTCTNLLIIRTNYEKLHYWWNSIKQKIYRLSSV